MYHSGNWELFDKDTVINTNTGFKENQPEIYRVKMECGSIFKFKIFLYTETGTMIGHLVLATTSGNVYCKEGGRKNYYSGEKEDFTFSGLSCIGNVQVIQIIRTRSTVKYVNNGK